MRAPLNSDIFVEGPVGHVVNMCGCKCNHTADMPLAYSLYLLKFVCLRLRFGVAVNKLQLRAFAMYFYLELERQ